MSEQQKYRAHPAIANSDLKYLSNPQLFQLYKQQQVAGESTDYFAFGSLVDDYLLSSQEQFDEKYIMQKEMNTPGSPNQTKFVEAVIAHEGDLQTADIAGYYAQNYSKANEEKALELYSDLKQYIQFQEILKSKKMYTEDQLETLNNIKQNCRNHSQINRLLFEPKLGMVTMSHKKIVDKELYGINWKGEMDRVVVDTIDKVIYNIDVKTSSKFLDSFGYYYMLYNYDRQQALYRELLKKELVDKGIVEDIDEYMIKTRCIYISSQNINQVACIPIPEAVLQNGLKKLEHAATQIKYHREHGWEHTVSYMKNDGLDIIEWDEFLNN